MRLFRKSAARSYDPFAGSGKVLPDGWTCTARPEKGGIRVRVERDGQGFDLFMNARAIAAQPGGDGDAGIRRRALGWIAALERAGGREDADPAARLPTSTAH
jgi:hypothetical protein